MKIKRSRGEIAFDVFNILFMLLLCAVTLYPFLYVVSRSVMPEVERSMRPFALIPHSLDFGGYEFIFMRGSLLLNSFSVTIFRTVLGTLLSLLIEAMFAYAIAKRDYPLRVPLTMMIAFTMWFSGGLIPTFLVVKNVGLYNSIWVYVVPKLMSAWNILIMRNFFQQIPESLPESARIDGANEFQILFRVVIPLSTAVLATMALFHMVGHWNEWFQSLIYISDRKKWTAQAVLRQVLDSARQTDLLDEVGVSSPPPALTVQMATIVVVSFPIVCVYPFLQKYFTKGVLIGSVKG